MLPYMPVLQSWIPLISKRYLKLEFGNLFWNYGCFLLWIFIALDKEAFHDSQHNLQYKSKSKFENIFKKSKLLSYRVIWFFQIFFWALK